MNGIEQALNGQTPVIRVNVQDADGALLASQFGVRGVPTLIVWRNGEVLRQVGRLDKLSVIQATQP